jgi:hypothetical protein
VLVPTHCKLCLQEKKLARSHVLPEFFYQNVYDKLHRFASVSSHPRQKTKLFEIGYRERLLCTDCEGQLSRYESYAAGILRNADDYRLPNTKVIKIPNFDYRLFKLFGLSLIWRCHASSLHTFQKVRLGPHAEEIRSMLLAEDPSRPSKYCFALTKINRLGSKETAIIAPGRSQVLGHTAYILMAHGYDWIFIVSSHSRELLDEGYPFVGAESSLVILVNDLTEAQFVQLLQQRIGNLVEKEKREREGRE